MNNQNDVRPRLKGIWIDNDKSMTSFDASFPFTSIDLELSHETLSIIMWRHDSTDKHLQDKGVLELVKLCVTTYFKYNGRISKQTSMGCPI